MKNNEQQLFKNLTPAEPRADLLDRIIYHISQEQKLAMSLRLKVRLFVSSAMTITMAVFFIPMWNWFQAEISQTGFSQFLSLISSDISSIGNYWQDLGLSLLESMPFFSFIGVLAIIFVFLFAIQYALRDIKTFFSSRHLPLLKI